MKVGILDHASMKFGGSQLLVAWMARTFSRQADVEVIHTGEGYTLERMAGAFALDLAGVRERIVAGSDRSFAITGVGALLRHLARGWRRDRALTRPYDLFVYAGHRVPPFSSARRSVVYCNFPFETRLGPSGRFGARWSGRRGVDRRLRLAVSEWLWRRRLRGYTTVFGNSRFTCDWIERLWAVEAEVLYPPVAVTAPAADKQDVVVSVGRFAGTDRKNHRQQLAAFRRFAAGAGAGWRLCLIGFCGALPEDRQYLAALREEAAELPVSFLVNADRATVLATLAEAKLFWHTPGLREAGRVAPRHLEHFGIATVEAMAAGCVPVVAAYGGQPEIVGADLQRFACRNEDELVQRSDLARDERLRAEAERVARERSRAFGPEAFERRLGRLVAEVGPAAHPRLHRPAASQARGRVAAS